MKKGVKLEAEYGAGARARQGGRAGRGFVYTMVIIIDPAPGDHAVGAVELRLGGQPAGRHVGSVLVQGQMEIVGTVEDASGLLVHGEMMQVEDRDGGARLVLHRVWKKCGRSSGVTAACVARSHRGGAAWAMRAGQVRRAGRGGAV